MIASDTIKNIFTNKWNDVLKDSTPIEFKKNQTLFYQGHEPCGSFVIIDGDVVLTAASRNKEGSVVMHAPHFVPLGVDLIYAHQTYPFSAIATSDGHAFFISKSTVLEDLFNEK